MKKILVAIGALVWAGAAFAGDFHYGSSLRCSQCHTMHASRAHGFSGDATAIDTEKLLHVNTGNPNPNLLIQVGTNATCLACHDNGSLAPDVLGAAVTAFGDSAAGHRSAGALNAAVGQSFTAPGYSEWMGHTMGSPDQPPGVILGAFDANMNEGFNCAQCHKVHGSDGRYRNLGTVGGTFYPTYNAIDPATGNRTTTTFDSTKDVTVTVPGRSYDTVNVTFGIGGGGMAKYCAECHGNFHGVANTEVGDGLNFKRHPTDNLAATRTDNGELADNGQTAVVRPSWAANKTGFQAGCLSCHKAHGNERGYGLIYPTGAAAVVNYENGDATADAAGVYPLRNLCSTCHEEGQVGTQPAGSL